ncbi:MAG: hypothetical protein QNL04_03100 [SAR324 cluster bacterium]|nr:hypothetical protein [SAR324 cluster bacterium]
MADPVEIVTWAQVAKDYQSLAGVALGIIGTILITVITVITNRFSFDKEKLVQKSIQDRENLAHKRTSTTKKIEEDLVRLENLCILVDRFLVNIQKTIFIVKTLDPMRKGDTLFVNADPIKMEKEAETVSENLFEVFSVFLVRFPLLRPDFNELAQLKIKEKYPSVLAGQRGLTKSAKDNLDAQFDIANKKKSDLHLKIEEYAQNLREGKVH